MQETPQVTSRFLSMTRRVIAPSAMQASAQVCARSCRCRSLSIAKSGTELILRLLASHGAEADALILKEEDDTALGSTDKFLSSRLRYMSDELGQDICLLQSGDTEIGVMMGWERGISAFSFGSPILFCMLTGGSMLSAGNGVQDVR
jgi:hypothetical protein